MTDARTFPTDSPPARLLEDFSVEITGKDADTFIASAGSLPPRTRVNVTFLASETLDVRRAAARTVASHGHLPMPHVAARRLASVDELQNSLSAFADDGTSDSLFVIAGDPATPVGPFDGAADVIEAADLRAHAVTRVGISGYPEGHPDIPDSELDAALDRKVQSIRDQGIRGEFITQFGFDTEPVLRWIEYVRAKGIDWPIRVGVPGPAGIKRLISYASRFGVASSAGIAKKYGFSITNLLGTAGPDRFIEELAARYDESSHGDLKLHFYTFGGLKATAEWIQRFQEPTR
ncbi:methylenetetrahydrofolate reductase [Herbiconiux sp. A18JL235]|uniref:Methylenetetrahydrofolate reductase n=1 Tax=Herbiconiux sp. A18JL235 TaxID=3152363 RepID=A0AB39BI58_9MICO